MLPSSSCALSLKPSVAYLVLNFCALWKKQTTLSSFAYAGIPYQVLGDSSGALALTSACRRSPIARSGCGSAASFASTSVSPSPFSAPVARLAFALVSWTYSFMAARSSSVNIRVAPPVAAALLDGFCALFLTAFMVNSFPTGSFDTELLRVFRVQPLPAFELHGLRAHDAAERGSAEKMIQNVEAKVPSGSAHCNVLAGDVGPQRQARTTAERLELPSDVEAAPVIFEQLGRLSAGHLRLGDAQRRRAYRGELHCGSGGAEVGIGVERRPFPQACRVRQRLPDLLRWMAQLAHEDQCPVVAVLADLGTGGTRLV